MKDVEKLPIILKIISLVLQDHEYKENEESFYEICRDYVLGLNVSINDIKKVVDKLLIFK